MGIQAPSPDVLPMHRQCDVLLGPLEQLGILSMGACHLQVRVVCGWRCVCVRVWWMFSVGSVWTGVCGIAAVPYLVMAVLHLVTAAPHPACRPSPRSWRPTPR